MLGCGNSKLSEDVRVGLMHLRYLKCGDSDIVYL